MERLTIADGVVISHPGTQHVYQAVAAAEEADLLINFVTAVYRTQRPPWNLDLWLPGPLGRAARRQLERRWHPDIDPTKVVTIPTYHALASLGQRLVSISRNDDWDLGEWADRRFDATVARRLARYSGRVLIHAFERGALATFRAAVQLRLARLLDVPSTHERHVEALRLEGAMVTDDSVARLRGERELADYLLVPSDQTLECLVENGTSPDKLLKLPYGADPEKFRPSPRRPSRPSFRVLYVGQIGLRKGVRYLLEAWSTLRLSDSELVLVGGADKHGLSILREYRGSWRWVGQVSRGIVHQFFEDSDVFVFPSLAEGSAIVTYEAMAAALPVVTTVNSGSVMRDQREGILVPARDARSIADAIDFLFRNPKIRLEMGRNARLRIEEGYTWQHYRRRLMRIYEAILARRPPAIAPDGTVEA